MYVVQIVCFEKKVKPKFQFDGWIHVGTDRWMQILENRLFLN